MLAAQEAMFHRFSPTLRAQLLEILRGNLAPLQDLVADQSQARLTARALQALIGVHDALPIEELRRPGADAEAARRFALLHSWLSADQPRIDAISELQRSAGDSTILLTIGEAWRSLSTGSFSSCSLRHENLDEVSRVEVAVLNALAALEGNELASAAQHARRATRMARSEGLVLFEYLAGLTLARVRRHASQPHLALRVLSALQKVLPNPWGGWLEFELAMAQDGVGASTWPPAEALRAAADGDARHFDVPALWRREIAEVAAAMDPQLDAPPTIRPWLNVETNEVPGSLCGLSWSTIDASGSQKAGVFVLYRTGVAPRRLLRRAAIRLGNLSGDAHPLSQQRVLTAIAVLASVKCGVSRARLFRETYGFAFDAPIHSALCRQLLRRVRQRLPATAALERSADRIRIISDEPLFVPDPRCAPSLDELILQFLGRSAGSAGAPQIASALGIPRRTVQTTLKSLVDTGCCDMVRQGRQILYQFEDTTFWKPTLERMTHRALDSTS